MRASYDRAQRRLLLAGSAVPLRVGAPSLDLVVGKETDVAAVQTVAFCC
jgi:hypothetical protein